MNPRRPDAVSPAVQATEVPLAEEARALRRDILEALHRTGGGHYGGSLSVIDVLLTLYRRQLRVSPQAPRHPERDRLILSKGHAAIALYAVLRRLGYFEEPLASYAAFGSPLEGHPDMLRLPGVDCSTGSLGQGLSVGLGAALALRSLALAGTPRVWVVLGDGECQEGQVWEAAMLAAQQQAGHLHAVVDVNRFQEWGVSPPPGAPAAPVVPVQALAAKWRAFGWRVLECDGHDLLALQRTCAELAEGAAVAAPAVLLAHTVKGKGVPMIEADPPRFHCCAVTDDEHRLLLESLA